MQIWEGTANENSDCMLLSEILYIRVSFSLAVPHHICILFDIRHTVVCSPDFLLLRFPLTVSLARRAIQFNNRHISSLQSNAILAFDKLMSPLPLSQDARLWGEGWQSGCSQSAGTTSSCSASTTGARDVGIAGEPPSTHCSRICNECRMW